MLNGGSSTDFVPLGDWLRARRACAVPTSAVLKIEETATEEAQPEGAPEIVFFAEEIALLRLRAIESFERARRRLLERFAEEVLARELQSSSADIEAIAQKALVAFAEESPVSFAVSPADAAYIRIDASVRVDAGLQPGDIIVHISDGHLVSPLRLRVARGIQETLLEEGSL